MHLVHHRERIWSEFDERKWKQTEIWLLIGLIVVLYKYKSITYELFPILFFLLLVVTKLEMMF